MTAAFEYAGLPSRVVLADGAVDRIGKYVDGMGGSRVMLVCGGKTGRSRLVARVRSALSSRLALVFDAIVEHSGTRIVEEGARLASQARADMLLAVGGGSASDTAKAIAILLAEGGPL